MNGFQGSSFFQLADDWANVQLSTLLLGFAVYFLPFRQRPWAMVLAVLGVIAPMLSSNPLRSFVFSYWLILPLWTLVVVLLANIPRRVKNTGICAKCKYNLTGNVSGICPRVWNTASHFTAEISAKSRSAGRQIGCDRVKSGLHVNVRRSMFDFRCWL